MQPYSRYSQVFSLFLQINCAIHFDELPMDFTVVDAETAALSTALFTKIILWNIQRMCRNEEVFVVFFGGGGGSF